MLNDGELKIKTPNPVTEDTKATSDGTPSDPATGTTDWRVFNMGFEDPDDKDLWLVFYSVANTQFNLDNFPGLTPDQVGLEIGGPDWAFLKASENEEDYFYPAVYLGDLEKCTADGAPQKARNCPADTKALAHIQYRVLTNLPLVEGSYMYPQYWVGRANAPMPSTPEPSGALLFGAGVGCLAAFRRRWC
jgi:hypothetical protein